MRLIKPGPGELLDRVTILTLKVKAATEVKKPFRHYVEEKDEIERILHAEYGVTPGEPRWKKWRKQLHAINEEIWVAIDRLRAAQTDAEAGRYGRIALHGNDDRAVVIGDVNRACGFNSGPEKVS